MCDPDGRIEHALPFWWPFLPKVVLGRQILRPHPYLPSMDVFPPFSQERGRMDTPPSPTFLLITRRSRIPPFRCWHYTNVSRPPFSEQCGTIPSPPRPSPPYPLRSLIGFFFYPFPWVRWIQFSFFHPPLFLTVCPDQAYPQSARSTQLTDLPQSLFFLYSVFSPLSIKGLMFLFWDWRHFSYHLFEHPPSPRFFSSPSPPFALV